MGEQCRRSVHGGGNGEPTPFCDDLTLGFNIDVTTHI